jgi:hypothetical protein
MNRVSGAALVTHTRRSDLGSHEFIDNYGKALQLLCEMALDMIPTIYDSERVLRIIKGDGTEDQIKVNGQDADGNVINDLKAGSYDCTVTIGPSYQTARQETLATLIDAAKTIPAIAEVAPDLIARAIDNPDSDELTKRLRAVLIQKGVIQPTPQEKQSMPPPQPNPVQQAEAMRALALAHKDTANASIAINKAQNSDLETRRMVADIARQELNNILSAQKVTSQHPEAFVAHLQSQLMQGNSQTT